MEYEWDENKRSSNLLKHGLDFLAADLVLSSQYCLNVKSQRHNELRTQSFAYVFDVLAVLTVVYYPGKQCRIISFRRASRDEREVYHEWLENDYKDSK